MQTNIGISDHDCKRLAEALSGVLADTFALYFKTHGYHWNVEGPHFKELHDMFEEQYQELWEAMDDIAERVRALGHYAPGSPEKLLDLTDLTADDGAPEAADMLERLIAGHEAAVKRIRVAISAAQEATDEGTADLLIERERAHLKAAWMLRATAK